MKKYIYLLIIGFSTANSLAQNVADGLRLGLSGNNGTARFQAMGGAFGSLGGDFSAINVNPAGSAIFSNNQWSISLNNNLLKNSTKYFGVKNETEQNSINLNQLAGVFVFENNDNRSEWNKFSLAVNYEKISDFDNDIFSVGTNDNSVASYFTSYANANGNQGGIPLEVLENANYEDLNFTDQQAWLGYQAFVINPDSNNLNNTSYNSNIRSGGKYFQQNASIIRGQNSKINFNLSGQYQKWLSVGVNLNSHFTDYKESTTFIETNKNPDVGTNERISKLQFNNDIHTFGSGFSMQFGFIAKLDDMFRIGASYESPTWYELNDEVKQSLQTTLSTTLTPDFKNVNKNPEITIYEPYQLQTPSKLTGSASVIFSKKGLISLDVTRTDYSNTTFGPLQDFEGLNNDLSNRLASSLSFKLGTEYRFNQWSFRGGYRNEQSPYKNKKVMGDLFGLSSGIGYNWGDVKLDVAYAYSKRNNQNQFFKQGFNDFSSTTGINNNITFTLVFEL